MYIFIPTHFLQVKHNKVSNENKNIKHMQFNIKFYSEVLETIIYK